MVKRTSTIIDIKAPTLLCVVAALSDRCYIVTLLHLLQYKLRMVMSTPVIQNADLCLSLLLSPLKFSV